MVTRPVLDRKDKDLVTFPSDVLWPAAKTGLVAALPGLTVGGIAATIRSVPAATAFTIVSGLQWSAIGFTYWGIRTSILNKDGLANFYRLTRGTPLQPRQDLEPTKDERLWASSIAGGGTGAVLGALFRNRTNILPGTLMFTLFGYVAQKAYFHLDERHLLVEEKKLAPGPKGPNFLQRMAEKKWSPFTELSDEEYETMLNEKLLKIRTEIALIDDRIEGLRGKGMGVGVGKEGTVQQVQERGHERR